MIRHTQTVKLIAAGVFIVVSVAMSAVPVAIARNGRRLLIDGLIQRMDRQSRRIIVWEYKSGDSTHRSMRGDQ